MTSLIIFSKDRTIQLDLLLRSKEKHCSDLYDEVFVLYSFSNFNFKLGYQKLKKEWPLVQFIEETDFRKDVFEILNKAKNDIVCVLADDCIFYRDVDCVKDIPLILSRENVASFTLGIGGDSRYSFNLKYHYELPEFTKIGNALVWNWKTADQGEFSCPFMLAANFYKKSDYIQRLSAITFNNPSWFECNLQKHWQKEFPEKMPDLCACGTVQFMVHSMNNVVQNTFRNPYGVDHYYSSAELNLRYLSDQIIDLDQLNFDHVDGLHKEIKFYFKKR